MEGAPSKHGHEGAPSPRGEPPRWLRIGSLGWKGMIAIFSAIPIIAGGIAVTAKLFSGPEPPAVVRAHMSGVSLDRVSWAGFSAHNRTLFGAVRTPAGDSTVAAIRVRPASYIVAQSPDTTNTDTQPTDTTTTQPSDTTTTQPTDTTTTQPTDTTETHTGKTETQPTTTTNTDTQSTDTTTTTYPTPSPNLDSAQQQHVRNITIQITKGHRVPQDCSQSLADRRCKLPDNLSGGPLNGGPYVAIRDRDGNAQIRTYDHVALVLHHARTHRNADGSRKQDIEGVSIAFEVRLIGFAGRTVNVLWSLWGRGHTSVPDDWTPNREVGPVRPTSGDDTQDGQFFVPLPARRGRYYVALQVRDDRGQVVARGRTHVFR
jgi:hypothetical protein